MNDLAHQQLAAIRERLAKATPGAKYVEQETRVYSEGSGRCIQDFYQGADFYAEACGNAEFFAHGWCDIDTLLALLADAERERDTARLSRDSSDDQLVTLADWLREKFGVDNNKVIGERSGQYTLAGVVMQTIEQELAAANNRAEQAAAARQAEIADQLEERAAKLRHIGQTDKSNELVYVAGLLRADAIERGEFREKS